MAGVAVVDEALMVTSNNIIEMQRQIARLTETSGRIEGKIDTFIEQMGKQDDRTTALAKDHETRMRSLEKWRWMHTLPIAGLVAFIANKLGIPIGHT